MAKSQARKLALATAGALALGIALAPLSAAAAEALLTGAVKAAAGEKLSGVTVTAKAEGSTIATSVFTDEDGNYYFPPLAEGKYKVWAQALGLSRSDSTVDLAGTKHQDFTLQPLVDFEAKVRQLPGDLILAALPDQTPEDARMKQLVRNECTSCHTPSYPLQFKFDEAGWTAILKIMERVNVLGVYQGPNAKPHGIVQFHEQELAAYLARARGPGESSLKIAYPPRPSGEAARVVYRVYDVPLDPDANLPTNFIQNPGTDWTEGTPSKIVPGYSQHDAWLDLDGNIWFTSSLPNKRTTLARIDPNSGAVKTFKVDAPQGMAAATHGMTRDPQGIIWFSVNNGRGSLGRLDPKTQEIKVFTPPASMSPTGGAVTVDWDGKGKIWISAPDGVLRFDPETSEFQEFKSTVFKTPQGTGTTYGVAADRNGNGYWAEMQLDIVGVGDAKTGQAGQVKLAPVAQQAALVTPEEKKFYDSFTQQSFDQPFPWAQGPRRMGADKTGDFIYVGNSWGGNLARININTNEVTYIPLPPNLQPYHATVDTKHNVWTNVWMSDKLAKYDPAAGKWTVFELPVRGSEVRYVSLLEKSDGNTEAVLPSFRLKEVTTMTTRSQAEIDALKQRAR